MRRMARAATTAPSGNMRSASGRASAKASSWPVRAGTDVGSDRAGELTSGQDVVTALPSHAKLGCRPRSRMWPLLLGSGSDVPWSFRSLSVPLVGAAPPTSSGRGRSTGSGQAGPESRGVRPAVRWLTAGSVGIAAVAATSTVPAKVDETAEAVARTLKTPTNRRDFVFTKDFPSYAGTALSKDASCVPDVGRHTKFIPGPEQAEDPSEIAE
jgi:hypothetical protein